MKLLDPIAKDISLSQLIIKQELKSFNISRPPEELEHLSEQLTSDGIIRDPFVVWVTDEGLVLVDGFTRYELGPSCNITTAKAYLYEFTDMSEARYWIQINQQSRRNLTDLQKTYFIGTIYNEIESSKDKLSSFMMAKGHEDIANAINKQKEVNISEVLMEHLQVSKSKLFRSARFATSITKIRKKNNDLANQILNNTVVDSKGIPVEVTIKEIEKLYKADLPGKIKSWDDVYDVEASKEATKPGDAPTGESEGQAPKTKDTITPIIKDYIKAPTREVYEDLCRLLEEHLHANTNGMRKSA